MASLSVMPVLFAGLAPICELAPVCALLPFVGEVDVAGVWLVTGGDACGGAVVPFCDWPSVFCCISMDIMRGLCGSVLPGFGFV